MSRTALIIGAGPAGLTAALELLDRTDIRPIIVEASHAIGGLSQTVQHGGNRLDIGGHRFFSKSDRVLDWWLDKLPLEQRVADDPNVALTYQHKSHTLAGSGGGPDPETTEAVMLLRPRKSRIYHRSLFFDYPLQLTPQTLAKLGMTNALRIGASYTRAHVRPRLPELTLEDFLINRFGTQLYRTFFKDYTEKVWGVPCAEISADWGAQRIKGLSLRGALAHFLRNAIPTGGTRDIRQGETSLIEQFLYPKRGPGQLWDEVARRVVDKGGELHLGHRVTSLQADTEGHLTAAQTETADGERRDWSADLFFSTMPVRALVKALQPTMVVPEAVQQVATGLRYRDFLTVGLLADHLQVHDIENGRRVRIRDNWIYVQEPNVVMGRIQIFNNWSPWMVANPDQTWIGLEYFCSVHDDMWARSDEDLTEFAIQEAHQIGILDPTLVRDSVVVRMPQAYPAYFGSYDRFATLREWTDGIDNLVLIGRNGMHRYNNQDHSMLSAMVAVDGLAAGTLDRDAIWAVNTEDDYQEA